MGIAEIRGGKIGGGLGVPEHLGQTNYAEICILVTKYKTHFETVAQKAT